jgi:pyruvate formate lyase activating enzyme
MKALISGIKRMEIHDGDGLRTTVFFKGCPLRCIWCHNPESLSFTPQIAYFKEKCIGCKLCVSVCAENVFKNHIPPFEPCSFCFKCIKECPTNALVGYGEEYTLDKLLSVVLQDELFFKNGNGGVTLSGGECLAQAEFVTEFIKALYERGISVNVDTCGHVKREVFEKIFPYVDTFLYDVKAFDASMHRELTGKDNVLILDNLKYLSSKGAKIEVRYPLVKGYNDSECENIAKMLSKLSIKRVKILKYHCFATSRYQALGYVNTMPNTETTFEDIESCIEIFKSYGVEAINGMKS